MDTFSDTITIRNDGTQSIDSFSSVTVDSNPATYLVTTQDTSLVGYWSMNEDNGAKVADNGGNNNSGVNNKIIYWWANKKWAVSNNQDSQCVVSGHPHSRNLHDKHV